MDVKDFIFIILLQLLSNVIFSLAKNFYDRYQIVPKKVKPADENKVKQTTETNDEVQNYEPENSQEEVIIDESITQKEIKIEDPVSQREITIDGIVYELRPKIESMTKAQFINYVLDKEKIAFRVGDTVHFDDETIKALVGNIKFKVLSFEPYLINGKRVDAYLNVELKQINSEKIHYYISSVLEKTV